MDYDFSRLSPRSFEQLIQALTLRYVSRHALIFGDGPDGGREATLDGRLEFPTVDDPWDGYTVVQAKCRIVADVSSESGSDWAVDQLSRELRTYETRPDRRRPSNYLFATNVRLSSSERRGGKDRLIELLEGRGAALSIRAFDIWDADKLGAFLDDAHDVRRAYRAWITPGDVLGALLEELEAGPEFESSMALYLQKELLADQYANLEQAGRAADELIPIGQVFVDLPAFDERRSDPAADDDSIGFIAEMLAATSERFADQDLARLKGPSNARRVLVGGPGQGKTTIGQFLCQLFRASYLLRRGGVLSLEAQTAVDSVRRYCSDEGLGLPATPRFPVRVVLNEFAAHLAENAESTLLRFIVQRVARRAGEEISESVFRRWLGVAPWLLVLDGLDEVPATANRDAVLAAVSDLWVDLGEAASDVVVLATTRPQGYNDDFSPRHYTHRWLAPLSADRALHYAERLVAIRYAEDEDRQNKITSRLRRASDQDSTARLMRSPLQVTILATLVERMGQPPEDRWSLFREYYRVIYQREVERDIPAANVLRDYQADIDIIHARVGLLLQAEGERAGHLESKLPRERFERLVVSRLLEEGHAEPEAAAVTTAIVDAAGTRLVFLVGLEAGEVGFEIRSLQEFMAAEGLLQSGDELIPERLRGIAPYIAWRNVFLFAAGRCFAEKQHLRDTVFTICEELSDRSTDALLAAGRLGDHLALELLEDGPARKQPKFTRLFAGVAAGLLELPASDVHDRLAVVYDERARDLYEEAVARLLRSDDASATGAWRYLAQLSDRGVTWASEALERSWPDTHKAVDRVLAVLDESIVPFVVRDRAIDGLKEFCGSAWDVRSLAMTLARQPSGEGWVRSLTELVHSYRYREELLTGAQQDVWVGHGLAVRIVGFAAPESAGKLKNLREIRGSSPVWDEAIAHIEFVLEPSAATLEQALLVGADARDAGVARWTPWDVPWPLAACVTVGQDSETLRALASRATEGELGDLDDWLQAELRWKNKGVTPTDLQHVDSPSQWPFSRDIAVHGFPLAAADWSMYVGDPELVRELYSVVPELSAGRSGGHLARVLLEMLPRERHNGDAGENPDPRDVASLLTAAAGTIPPPYAGRVVSAIDWRSSGLSAAHETIVDLLGEASAFVGPVRVEESQLRAWVEWYMREPRRFGLLRLLANHPISWGVRSQLPPPRTTESLSVGASALHAILTCEISKVEDAVTLLRSSDTYLADDAWEALTFAPPHDFGVAVIVRLVNDQATLTRFRQSRLQSIIAETISRQLSVLQDPDAWRRLQLFDVPS